MVKPSSTYAVLRNKLACRFGVAMKIRQLLAVAVVPSLLSFGTGFSVPVVANARPAQQGALAQDCKPEGLQANNSWYCYSESNTAVVFVHGFISDSERAWRSSRSGYWPDFVVRDTTFETRPNEHPAVFLAGFDTSKHSGSYSIQDAANDLFAALERPINGHPPVMSKRRILFVAHSTGGIVVQQMLLSKREDFKYSAVGLFFVASPSNGTAWATRLSLLNRYYANQMASDLTQNNPKLLNLNREFREALADGRMPATVGMDIFETKFIGTSGWMGDWLPWLRTTTFVDADAGSAFPTFRRGSNLDHFEIAKPVSMGAWSHLMLQDFFRTSFKNLKGREFEPAGQLAVSGRVASDNSKLTNESGYQSESSVPGVYTISFNRTFGKDPTCRVFTDGPSGVRATVPEGACTKKGFTVVGRNAQGAPAPVAFTFFVYYGQD